MPRVPRPCRLVCDRAGNLTLLSALLKVKVPALSRQERGTRVGLLTLLSRVVKSKSPPCPAKNAGQGWGTLSTSWLFLLLDGCCYHLQRLSRNAGAGRSHHTQWENLR